MNPEHPAPLPVPADESRRDESELNAAREAVRLRLEHVFRACDVENDDASSMLFKSVLDYRLETLR